jgi:ABC-2 type transport system permease protein
LNRSQLRAMLWMRSRILANRLNRSGKLSKALLSILVAGSFLVAAGLFVLALLVGLAELGSAEPKHILWTWIGLALGFLFFWMIGLMTELQRSDGMSFQNLLHLPISLGWVFLYNYVSSFVSLSILIFLPPMLGLAVALILVHGPLMLIGLLLVLAFFGMITALTYHLRGWLARLMEDKRRGRSIVMGITFGFILMVQLPNLINITVSSNSSQQRAEGRELHNQSLQRGPGQAEAVAKWEAFQQAEATKEEKIEEWVSLASMILPFGWLPFGMRASFEGRWLLGLLCAFGMFCLAGLSLRRSFQTTLVAIVQGGGAAIAVKKNTPRETAAARRSRGKIPLVEKKLPFIGRQASAIATAGLQSLLRAPEAKMMLLSPILMIGLFCFFLAKNENPASLQTIAPGMALGAIAIGILSFQQVLQNLFGLDRDGFRSYLLAPIPRHLILLGKNLALAPIVLCSGFVTIVVLQFFVTMDVQHFLGTLLEVFSAYLIFCMLGNYISIISPMRLQGVGMKASGAKLRFFLLQILSFVLNPLVLSPLLLPWGVESLQRDAIWVAWIPTYLLLHGLLLIATLVLYRWVLRKQGDLLQSREQLVLETITRG